MDDKAIKVLLVEDSPTDVFLLREALAAAPSAQFELAHTERLAEALRRLDEDRFDAVLLDLGLPDSQGLETFAHLQERFPGTPVVVLTGLDDSSLAMRAVQLGAQDYLVKKQLSPGMLARVIRYSIERKRAEEALRQSEERYRDLFENANDIIYTSDMAGNITSLNKAGTQILGYTSEEALRLNVVHLVAPEYLNVVRMMIAGDLAERDKDFSLTPTAYEMEVMTKDGRRVALEVSARLMRRHGRVVEIQSIARDITERKHLELQLRQSQKMEAIGRLAGGVAHDFNNLLTAIIGYSQIALGRLADDDTIRREIEEIVKAGGRASSLTSQLLAFSRKQMIQMKVLDLNAVVSDMKKMLGRLIGEDIELHTALDPSLGRVKTDPGQMEQVILNLAINARDAMPAGGKLTIETANVYLSDEYAQKRVAIEPGNYVMLAISDTGIGMDQETQSRIFEPFFTTKEQGKGTGLGLSTVYGIVRQSGGYVWVYSEPQQGTVFKIFLPLVEEAALSLDSPVEAASLNGSETVLVVEDDAGVRGLVCKLLKMKGYSVLEAAGGNHAIEICECHKGAIDLMITDVVMPQMSGCDLAERLMDLRPAMKVLYMSGYTDNSTLHHGVLSTDMAFIQKPFAPESLARKVREVLDEK